MAITITQERKKQRYLILVLALVIFVILFVIWLGFFRGEKEAPMQVAPAAIYSLPEIKIDFDFLRKSLKVEPLYLSAELTAEPGSPAPNQKINFKVNISGPVGSFPLTYQFDCNGDGKYDYKAENKYGKTFSAAGICQYGKAGDYAVEVFVDGDFKYFMNGEEKTEKKSAQAFASITVKEPNSNPVISFCDVNPTDGSILLDSKFNFKASAADPEGDKLSYLWNFGDGAVGDISSPSHQYQRPGNYFPFVQVFDLSSDGKRKGGTAICYPSSLLLLKEFRIFEEIPLFEGKMGRINPFIPY